MSRNKILAGLVATIAATAIAAPAQAQEVIPPSQPSTPTIISPAQPSTPTVSPAQPATPNLTPQEATIQMGNCKVAHSRHGYTYAVCSVAAENVPEGQSASISYKSSLKTFKPRTAGSWRGQTGTLTFTNDGSMPGQAPGTTSNMTGGIKLAFRDKTVAQVTKELIVGMTGSNNAAVTSPIAAPAGR
jgi:hypothetical protein